MHFVDTHAHLFDESAVGELSGILTRASHAGVRQIINVATTADSSLKTVDAALKNPGLFASVGIHPNHAQECQPGDFERIKDLVNHPKVVALGETGLDRYWDDCPWQTQLDNFQQHIELAVDTKLPLIIHTRDCYTEMIDVLRASRSRNEFAAVMHSFAGTTSQAAELLELGMYISFAGMLTFKKSELLRETAATIPLDRVLVETDSPYLSPEPHRGKRPNEPARVIHTASTLAGILGVSAGELADRTTKNARRLFHAMSDEQLVTQ